MSPNRVNNAPEKTCLLNGLSLVVYSQILNHGAILSLEIFSAGQLKILKGDWGQINST